MGNPFCNLSSYVWVSLIIIPYTAQLCFKCFFFFSVGMLHFRILKNVKTRTTKISYLSHVSFPRYGKGTVRGRRHLSPFFAWLILDPPFSSQLWFKPIWPFFTPLRPSILVGAQIQCSLLLTLQSKDT